MGIIVTQPSNNKHTNEMAPLRKSSSTRNSGQMTNKSDGGLRKVSTVGARSNSSVIGGRNASSTVGRKGLSARTNNTSSALGKKSATAKIMSSTVGNKAFSAGARN